MCTVTVCSSAMNSVLSGSHSDRKRKPPYISTPPLADTSMYRKSCSSDFEQVPEIQEFGFAERFCHGVRNVVVSVHVM